MTISQKEVEREEERRLNKLLGITTEETMKIETSIGKKVKALKKVSEILAALGGASIGMKEETKYITTHAELLKLHGKKVSFCFQGYCVDNAKIQVENTCFPTGNVCIDYCVNKVAISKCISEKDDKYEDNDRGVTCIQLLEPIQEETKKITCAKDFKNSYIDLSNTELNGEMTEERLGFAMTKCFGKDYCENNIEISEENNVFHNRKIVYIKPDDSRFDDIRCSTPESQEMARDEAKGNFPEYVLENYKEVSVHDIIGFDDPTSDEAIHSIRDKMGVEETTGKNESPYDIEGQEGEEGSYIVSMYNSSFEEENIIITQQNFPLIKAFLENDNKEGSRAWAFEMLDEGRKIRNKRWTRSDMFMRLEDEELVDKDGYQEGEYVKWFKDGWELYKEEPKKVKTMMLLKDALDENKTFIWWRVLDKGIEANSNTILDHVAVDDLIMAVESGLKVEIIEE